MGHRGHEEHAMSRFRVSLLAIVLLLLLASAVAAATTTVVLNVEGMTCGT